MVKAQKQTLADWVDARQERGRYCFVRDEAIRELGLTPSAFRMATHRLARRKRVVCIHKEFYLVIPLEHRTAGVLPPEWFLDDLMKHLGVRYYVGCLSAAAYHGASHQAAQVYQVVADRQMRPIRHAGLVVQFLYKKDISGTPISMLKSPAGYFPASTPEATAIDLLRYLRRVGEMNHVLTVLQELGEAIRPRLLVQAATADGNLAYAQRLGWLLEQTRFADRAKLLAAWCTRKAPGPARLHPAFPIANCPRDRRWNLWLNTTVEGDLG